MKDKILVIRMSALGDVAMTLPVVYSVCERYPDTDFYVLTRPFFTKIFIGAPDNLHLVSADTKGRHKGLRGLWRLIRELRRERFTAVADLHNVLRSWIIDIALRLGGARVAMVNKRRSQRLGKRIHEKQPDFIDRYTGVFARLGYPADLTFTSVFATPQETAVAVVHPAVGIAPFARYSNKTYPPGQMEQVIATLTARGVNVYLFGSRGAEAETLEAWSARHPRCLSLAGKMDIRDEIAVMSAMDVMVTMDSANHHLASIAGTRVISVWGSTTPVCGFGAYRQQPSDAVCAGLECQPCTVAGSPDCPLGTLACMKALTPGTIAARILEALTQNNRP